MIPVTFHVDVPLSPGRPLSVGPASRRPVGVRTRRAPLVREGRRVTVSAPRIGAAHVTTGSAARLVLGAAGNVVTAAMIGLAGKGVLSALIAGLIGYLESEALRATGAGALLSGSGSTELAAATAACLLLSLGVQAMLALKRFKL